VVRGAEIVAVSAEDSVPESVVAGGASEVVAVGGVAGEEVEVEGGHVVQRKAIRNGSR